MGIFTPAGDGCANDVQERLTISKSYKSEKDRRKSLYEATKVLIVDSEILASETLCENLLEHGFQPTVAHSARVGWEAANASHYDLVMLDATLAEGEGAGFELAQRLREAKFRQPILFITACTELADRIRAHEHGDDYLCKPAEVLEVVAKLKALSRRGPLLPATFTWRELKLVPEERKVFYKDKLISLSAVQYALVKLFLINPGQLFTYDEIIRRVWGADYTARSNLLVVHIRNIRKKIGDDEFVEAVRGVGYRLVE